MADVVGWDGLYEQDALAWAERQAGLLRRLAAGERVGEAVDWAHVVEEVAEVGLSELRACQSLLVQAMTHLLKLHAWPDSEAVAHWRGEIAGFLASARRNFTPSMGQRIDLAGLYADALYGVRAEELADAASLPAACPFVLDELLVERPGIVGLLRKLAERS